MAEIPNRVKLHLILYVNIIDTTEVSWYLKFELLLYKGYWRSQPSFQTSLALLGKNTMLQILVSVLHNSSSISGGTLSAQLQGIILNRGKHNKKVLRHVQFYILKSKWQDFLGVLIYAGYWKSMSCFSATWSNYYILDSDLLSLMLYSNS